MPAHLLLPVVSVYAIELSPTNNKAELLLPGCWLVAANPLQKPAVTETDSDKKILPL